jgi:serine/threonine-protein kinase
MPVFGHYELQAMVGKGGMAEVFRARDVTGLRKGQLIAIKRLMPELAKDKHYVDLFSAEAHLSQMLHHANIIETYEAGKVNEQYYMAMEYIDGRDLGQIVRRCRERKILLPVDFAVFLGATLLDALAYAHCAKGEQGERLNIVHCDISPSNLFISRVGEIKLGDFGIAKVRKADTGDVGRVWGKAYYLSPEALSGKVSAQVDLWAATATLYELLTNERCFAGKGFEEVATAVRKARPRQVRDLRPEVTPELNDAVMKGFAKNPADRYSDAAVFADALRGHFNELIGTPLAIAAVVRGLFGA